MVPHNSSCNHQLSTNHNASNSIALCSPFHAPPACLLSPLTLPAPLPPLAPDFDYKRVNNSKFPAPNSTFGFPGNSFEGETHSGFTTIFNAVWPTVQQALMQYVIPPTNSPDVGVKYVTVTGHSLGSAVATLVAYAVSLLLVGSW